MTIFNNFQFVDYLRLMLKFHATSKRQRRDLSRRQRQRRAEARQKRKPSEYRAMIVEMREPELAGGERFFIGSTHKLVIARGNDFHAHTNNNRERLTSSANSAAQYVEQRSQSHNVRELTTRRTESVRRTIVRLAPHILQNI